MMSKIYHNSRTSKWLMFLSEFDLKFIHQKYIKGQVIANQLADIPLQDNFPLYINLPNKDIFQVDVEKKFVPEEFDITMYFDGSKCEQGRGEGVILFTL